MAKKITCVREQSDGGPTASGGLAGAAGRLAAVGASSGFGARFY